MSIDNVLMAAGSTIAAGLFYYFGTIAFKDAAGNQNAVVA